MARGEGFRCGLVTGPGVNAIEAFLTSAGQAAEEFARRRSWRVGRWVGSWRAAALELFSRANERLGINVLSDEQMAAARGTVPAAEPRYPGATLSPGSGVRAGDLCAGFAVLGGERVELDAVSWRQPLGGQCTARERFFFHALDWVRELTDVYRATSRLEYLERAKSLTEHWISECLHAERPEYIWDDHGTALRAVVLCRLWCDCRVTEPQGSPFLRRLLTTIFKHASKLAQESFYRPGHNHGVTQAYALLAVGLLFPVHPSAHGWRELGRARIEDQLARNVSPEGLHREHSPSYHFAVLRQFYYTHLLANAHGMALSPSAVERLQSMLWWATHLVKPDGTLPALGDTWKASPSLLEEEDLVDWPADLVAHFRYSVGRGMAGRAPDCMSGLCPGGGVALLRSGWGESGPFRDERHLAVRISTFATAHIHRDAMSFELYGYGDDLIVDSGGPFGYGDPLRQFFQSTGAHNTVVVDGRDQAIGEARILHWRTSAALDVVDCEHDNYAPVVHRRAIIFVRPRYFLVFDRLRADSPHCYSQLFHLNPVLRAAMDGLGVVTQNPSGGPTVQILPLLTQEIGLRLHRGREQPRQGWVCVGDRREMPNTVVEYERRGTTVSFGVMIIPEAPGAHCAATALLHGNPFDETTCVEVTIDGRRQGIRLTPAGEVSIEEGI